MLNTEVVLLKGKSLVDLKMMYTVNVGQTYTTTAENTFFVSFEATSETEAGAYTMNLGF